MQGCEGTSTYDNSHCGNGPFDCGAPCKPGIQYAKKLCFPEYAFQTECAQCSVPVLGVTYEKAPCTNSTDTDLRFCTVPSASSKPCAASEFWTPCTEKEDGHCQACNMDVFKAPPGNYYITGCGGGYQDYNLNKRTALSSPCTNAGTYRRRGDWFTDNECVACDPPCVEGVSWEATACRDGANRYCPSCSTSECPAGTYKFANCTVAGGDRYLLCYAVLLCCISVLTCSDDNMSGSASRAASRRAAQRAATSPCPARRAPTGSASPARRSVPTTSGSTCLPCAPRPRMQRAATAPLLLSWAVRACHTTRI